MRKRTSSPLRRVLVCLAALILLAGAERAAAQTITSATVSGTTVTIEGAGLETTTGVTVGDAMLLGLSVVPDGTIFSAREK